MKRILLFVVAILVLGSGLFILKISNEISDITNDNFDEKEEYELLGSIIDKDIFLYGRKVNSGYDGMILKIGDKEKYTDWGSTFNITSFPPKLILADINSDNKDELIIIRVEGYGTGVHGEAINIIAPNTLDEIKIESPIDIIDNKVNFEITAEKFKIYIGDNVDILPLADYADYTEQFFNKIDYGQEINYLIEDNKIIAFMGLRFTPGPYIGHFTVSYKYNGNSLVLDSIIFTEGYPKHFLSL